MKYINKLTGVVLETDSKFVLEQMEKSEMFEKVEQVKKTPKKKEEE